MNREQIAEVEKRVLIPTYDRLPILAVRGEGCYIYDDAGKKYLDFLGGLAVNSLGYDHPEIMATLRDPAENLLHVSNLLYHPYQAPLAEKLTRLSGMDRAFLANSGTEAIEGAMKLVRAYARKHAAPGPFERFEILAMENSFHGRTFGALSATWPKKYREPFEPLPPGVRLVHLNDVAHLRESFTPQVAAVLVEVVQGEGGVVEIREDFLKAAAGLCRQRGALLICDEIQCGLGRTGRFFAFTKFGLQPDVVVVAKPLAAGLPLAAILAREEVAQAFSPGMHGTTFGGGPLQCRLALKVLEILERPGFLAHVAEMGDYFRKELEKLREDFLKTAAELCHAHGALLICDEIQCGLGRTGRFLAFTKFGLHPDLVVVAKSIAQMVQRTWPIFATGGRPISRNARESGLPISVLSL